MKRSVSLSLLLLTTFAMLFAEDNIAIGFEFFRGRSRPAVRHCLKAYNYQPSTLSLPPATVIAIAPIDQPKVLRLPNQDLNQGDSALTGRVEVRRKKFIPQRQAIAVGPVRLGQLALATYSTGQLDASGVILHDGGPTRSLKGANVTIRVRAFGGAAQFRGSLANATLIAETHQSMWVPRNQPMRISLVPLDPAPTTVETSHTGTSVVTTTGSGSEGANTSGTNSLPDSGPVTNSVTDVMGGAPLALRTRIAERFAEITHLEVVLEYERNP